MDLIEWFFGEQKGYRGQKAPWMKLRVGLENKIWEQVATERQIGSNNSKVG